MNGVNVVAAASIEPECVPVPEDIGAATVAFADGTIVKLCSGSVGRLHERQHTVWTVTETFRKVYFAGALSVVPSLTATSFRRNPR